MYWLHLQGSRSPRPLRMRPIGCLETSVRNYHSTLRKVPEEHRSHLHRDGSLEMTQITISFVCVPHAVALKHSVLLYPYT